MKHKSNYLVKGSLLSILLLLLTQSLHAYYNPAQRKWLSRNPIAERGGLNINGFVGNDGVNRSDYLGFAEIKVTITRQYRKWETVGTFSASATRSSARKCCGSVSGQTLELKKGKYDIGKKRGAKNYPIYEGTRKGEYSRSSNTSVNGQQRSRDKRYPNPGGEPRALIAGSIGEKNINIFSNTPKGPNQSSFGGTRMHHGVSCQSSEGCPIVGSNMQLAKIKNRYYPELNKGDTFTGHYFPGTNSMDKVLEINSFIECVEKNIGHRPSIEVSIQ